MTRETKEIMVELSLREQLEALQAKYDVLLDRIQVAFENLALEKCKKCGHYHLNHHVCYECGHDDSIEDE